jgi:EAL domain-containing protein (putative c-di-GMP-specific phosphodiesterase class I)/GGDEF domain-containing protein
MNGQASIVTNLRSDRDRFVAFAFAAADALVELDDQRRISYAVGAVHWLAGATADQLVGRPFVDLVIEDDHRLLLAAYATAEKQSRFGPVDLRLRAAGGREQRVALFASHLPDRANRLFLALSAKRTVPAAAAAVDPASRDAATGLLNKDSFATMALQLVKSSPAERPYQMTLLNVDGLTELEGRLDKKTAGDFLADVSSHLKVNSVNGESASRIDDNQFSIVHDGSVDVTALEQTISQRAQAVDPTGKGVTVGSTTVALDVADKLSEEDAARAILYTINKFSEKPGDFTVTALAEGYKLMLDETVEKIAEFRAIIKSGKFDVVFQPIVDLKTRKVHHSEALVRFKDSAPGQSPFALITFAEDVGVIGEFDLAMCRKVIEKIKKANDNGHALHIAVNLSGRSLENAVFLRDFKALLDAHNGLRKQLMFEVTESAEIVNLEQTNKLIRELRDKGHHVCLDDFGAGAAAFQYLRALDIDFVKIDGSYVREALSKPNGKSFLKAMASLCADIGIDTIAEMVEDEPVARFLIEAGVKYGQGYLFGKPAPGVVGQAGAA